MAVLDSNLGEIIKKIRKEKGMTQAELGKKIGVSGAMISHYEEGRRRPKYETRQRIAAALGVPLSSLSDFKHEKLPAEDIETLYDFMKSLTVEELPSTLLLMATVAAAKKEGYNERDSMFPPDPLMLLLLAGDRLNWDGRQKAIELLELLSKIPEYTE